ncbi:hypothetical protein OF83DRAFT_1053609 [Amylostereum chailletii]|nr:hypothetical protein OF83DRAFT_1053609 [Amylostereum chailletii]
MSFAFATRVRSFVPSCSRSAVNSALQRPVPPPRGAFIASVDAFLGSASCLGGIDSPEAFLKAIGRKSETKLSYDSWEGLFKADGATMRKAGLEVKDRRRYILWAVEKYRQGWSPKDIAHEPKPKKKVRGWGPAVQNGKRIRSRRKQ